MHDGPNLANMSAAAVELQGKKEREQRTKGEVKKKFGTVGPVRRPSASPLPSPLLLLPEFPNAGSRGLGQSDPFQTVPLQEE